MKINVIMKINLGNFFRKRKIFFTKGKVRKYLFIYQGDRTDG